MDSFLKMDIFFVVATVVTLVIGVLIAFVVWKLLRILEHVERIAAIAGKEAEHLSQDAAYLRGRMIGALDTVFSFIPRRRKRDQDKE